MKIFILSFLFIFTSCSNYVNNIHRQIDREDKVARGDTRQGMREHYAPYKSRFDVNGDKRPIKDPRTFSMSDGAYGSSFYRLTGLHGFHVLVGTLLLAVAGLRMMANHFTLNVAVGFECAG